MPTEKYPFDKIGIVGAGSMSSEMAQLFAEKGLAVSLFDVKPSNVDHILKLLDDPQNSSRPSSEDTRQKIKGFKTYEELVDSLGGKEKKKLFLFSIKHGSPADEVIQELGKWWCDGDVVLDGGNEWYASAERRQAELEPKGVRYIALGVWRLPIRPPWSLHLPIRSRPTLDLLMPLLESFACKDPRTGLACVTSMGPGGSGHYVKVVHNGIEQGMMGAVDEAWEIMRKCLHMSHDEVGDTFERWTNSDSGLLMHTFLLDIAVDICRRSDPSKRGKLLGRIQDKVVQDADDTEGTGFWTLMEAAKRHVSAPTISAAHFFRAASANRSQRLAISKSLVLDQGPHAAMEVGRENREKQLKDVESALTATFLASFVQGLNIISRASEDHQWNVSLHDCFRIWRERCIMRAEGIADLIQPLVELDPLCMNMLTKDQIAKEVWERMDALRRCVKRGIDWKAHIPTISASLDYFQYVGGTELPSMFMEAELDYFTLLRREVRARGLGKGRAASL